MILLVVRLLRLGNRGSECTRPTGEVKFLVSVPAEGSKRDWFRSVPLIMMRCADRREQKDSHSLFTSVARDCQRLGLCKPLKQEITMNLAVDSQRAFSHSV